MCLRTGIVFLITLLSLSCASGPAPLAKGTPGWYWQAAVETFAAGDLVKTAEHLDSLAKPGNEFADRAIPWQMVITAGMATGHMKAADGFEFGARANPPAAASFRKYMGEFRSRADRSALQFAQVFMGFQKAGSEGAIPLAFGLPQGSALPVSEITKAAQGIMLSAGEVSTLERRSTQREVLMTACLAVGAEDDTAKAQSVYGGEAATVSREVFIMAMATKLHEVAGYYDDRKLDRPDRLKQLNEIALAAAKALPENDETKALIGKIETAIKVAEKRIG